MRIRMSLVIGMGCAAAVAGVAVSQSGFAAQNPSPPKVTQVDPEQLAEVGAQPGQRAAAGKAAATSGAISGVVTGTGNKVVAGYTVEAFTADGNFIADTVTDASGRYTLAGLQAGPYKVRFSGPASGAAPWAMGWAGGSSVMTKAAVVNVGATPIKANITLPPSATVTGKVTGVPAGSEVRVCGGTFLDCRISTTAANGRFTVTGLAAGTDSIVVHSVGGVDLAFPKLPPRPGVPLKAKTTTDVVLNASTQAAPTITVGNKVVIPTSPPPPPDRTASTVTAAMLTTENGKRYVEVSASDGQGGSGLKYVQVRIGTKELSPSRYTTEALAAPGTGEVAVRVQDKAGNNSEWVVAK